MQLQAKYKLDFDRESGHNVQLRQQIDELQKRLSDEGPNPTGPGNADIQQRIFILQSQIAEKDHQLQLALKDNEFLQFKIEALQKLNDGPTSKPAKADKKCTYCGEKFFNTKDVQNHELHCASHPFLCHFGCNMTFENEAARVAHEAAAHGK